MTTTPVSFSPGEILRDELDERGWAAAEFAQIIGRPVQAVSEVLNDRKEITTDTAIEISRALGTSAEFWLNLQTNYRLRSANTDSKQLSDVERRARLRSLIPIREVTKRGWLPDTKNLDALEASVCQFLHMETIDGRPALRAAARRSGSADDFTPEQTAWLAFIGDLGAQRVVKRFDTDALGELASEVPSRLRDPLQLQHLGGWLGDCGVALVCEMPLRSSKLDGAAVWPDSGPPTIGLSTRGNRFDSFVFTLLHEMAHLWHGHVQLGAATVDEDLDAGPADAIQEEEANATATKWIFPRGLQVDESRVTTATVLRLAGEHSVHPSLVIGRLQREGRLAWSQLRSHIPRVRDLLPELGGRE